jgi:hypothetical protein
MEINGKGEGAMKEARQSIPRIEPREYLRALAAVRELAASEAEYGALWLCIRAYLLGAEEERRQKNE